MLKYALRNRLTSELVARPTDAVLYFPGYPGYGSTISDYSGQSNNGTITGATWTRLPSGLWYLDFDGTDDTISIANTAPFDFGTGDFSIIAWVKTSSATTQVIMTNRNVGATWWTFYIYGAVAGGTLRLEVAAGVVIDDTTTGWADGVWHRVTCSRASGTATFYVDGAARGSGARAETVNPTTPLVRVGALQGTEEEFLGSIALVRVSNVTATLAQETSGYQQERHLFNV